MRRDDLYLADEAFSLARPPKSCRSTRSMTACRRREAGPITMEISDVLPGGARCATGLRELADQGLKPPRVGRGVTQPTFSPVSAPARCADDGDGPSNSLEPRKPGLLRSVPAAGQAVAHQAPGEGFALDDR